MHLGRDRAWSSRGAVGVGLWMALALAIPSSNSAEPPPVSAPGRISHKQRLQDERRDALEALPLGELDAEQRTAVTALIGDATHRRLATEILRCDPQIYELLVDRPDVMVAIWRALDMSDMRVTRREDGTYEIDDPHGLAGTATFLRQTPEQRLVWFEGVYCGPLSPRPIASRMLLQLRSAHFQESDASWHVVHRLDVFFKLDSDAAAFFFQLLEPLATRQAGRNFSQIGEFLSIMSLCAAQRPEWTLQVAQSLEGVSDETRRGFAELVEAMAAPQPTPSLPATAVVRTKRTPPRHAHSSSVSQAAGTNDVRSKPAPAAAGER